MKAYTDPISIPELENAGEYEGFFRLVKFSKGTIATMELEGPKLILALLEFFSTKPEMVEQFKAALSLYELRQKAPGIGELFTRFMKGAAGEVGCQCAGCKLRRRIARIERAQDAKQN